MDKYWFCFNGRNGELAGSFNGFILHEDNIMVNSNEKHRKLRDNLLAESDWTVMTDSPLSSQ